MKDGRERRRDLEHDGPAHGPAQRRGAPGKRTRVQRLAASQPRGRAPSPIDTARDGVAAPGRSLPFGSQIQLSFGRHDVRDVQTAIGGDAAVASEAIGARAYAMGERIAFAESPDLHTAAHEAAHVVQQRAGIALDGGVGTAGDRYEQHADQVADLVVSGKSAEVALDAVPGRGGNLAPAVQRIEDPDAPASEPISEAVSGAIASLRDAWDAGAEELDRVARQLAASDLAGALAQLPEVAEGLLALWWPDHTGWTAVLGASGNASADLLLLAGVPAEVELDGNVACQVSVSRTAAAVTVAFKPSFVGNEGGAATIKAAKIPGGLVFKAAAGISMTIDLARIDWPGTALSLLSQGEFRAALAELFAGAVSLVRNTQIAVDGGITVDNELGLSLGDDGVLEALVAGGIGLGLRLSAKNPTETSGGLLQLDGDASAFLGLELAAMEGLPAEAPVILRLAQTLTEMNGTARTAAGMRVAVTMPPLSTGGSFGMEVGVTNALSGGFTVIGQSGAAEGKAEIVLGLSDIAGFIERLADGKGLDAAALVAASSGLHATLAASCELRQIGVLELLATWFPSLANVKLPETLTAKISAELAITSEEMAALIARNGQSWADFFAALWDGDVATALQTHADLVRDNAVDLVNVLESVTVHVEGQIISKEGGKELKDFGAEAGVGANASLWAVFDRTFAPDELGVPALQAWIRSVADGEEAAGSEAAGSEAA